MTETELDAFFVRCKERLIQKGMATLEEIRGLSDSDFEDLESCFSGLRLPLAYTRFMRHFGRGAGLFLSEFNYAYPLFLRNTNAYLWIWNTMEHPHETCIPAGHCLIFMQEEAIVFHYFYLVPDFPHSELSSSSGGIFSLEDPPVYYWHESMGSKGVRVASKFTDFIENAIENRQSMFPKLEEWQP